MATTESSAPSLLVSTESPRSATSPDSYDHLSVQMLLDLFPRVPAHSPRTGLTSAVGQLSSAPIHEHPSVTTPKSAVYASKPVTLKRFSSLLGRTGSVGAHTGSLHSTNATSTGHDSNQALFNGPGSQTRSSAADVFRRPSLFTPTRLNSRRTADSEASLSLTYTGTGSGRASPLPIGEDGAKKSPRDRVDQFRATASSVPEISDPSRLNVSIPAGLPDKDYVDLMTRACKGVIAPKDQDTLFKFICSLSPSRMADMQRAVHEMLSDKKAAVMEVGTIKRSSMSTLAEAFGRAAATFVEVSKYHLDFGLKGRRAKLNHEVSDSITIDLKNGGRPKYTLRPPDKKSTFYLLKIEPATGKLKPGKEEIKFTLQVKRPAILSEVIVLEVEGGYRHFFTVNISSEWSNFGASLSDYRLVEDVVTVGHRRLVPEPLAKLRKMLLKRNGLDAEEIFRKQVDEENISLARLQFDQKVRMEEMTCETITSLIKVWFRELPERLFEVTVEQVMKCETPEDIQALFESSVGPARDVAMWLLDLMSGVVAHKDTNRMNAKKLSIVMAPNVFPGSLGSTNATYLRKQADIFCQLLERHIATVTPIFDDLLEESPQDGDADPDE